MRKRKNILIDFRNLDNEKELWDILDLLCQKQQFSDFASKAIAEKIQKDYFDQEDQEDDGCSDLIKTLAKEIASLIQQNTNNTAKTEAITQNSQPKDYGSNLSKDKLKKLLN